MAHDFTTMFFQINDWHFLLKQITDKSNRIISNIWSFMSMTLPSVKMGIVSDNI
jgi:hypothetical protein